MTHKGIKSCRDKMNLTYTCVHEIMKTMYTPGYHRNAFVATHALRELIYGCFTNYSEI